MASGSSGRGLGKRVWGVPLGLATLFFLAGIVFWGGFNTVMEATNTEAFCISCHEMKDTVYQEYKEKIHYSNRSGVGAICSDCHVPREWGPKMLRKIHASKELWGKLTGTIDTPEKFEAKRLELAKHEWIRMKANDSLECRNCHRFDKMKFDVQKQLAQKQHQNAREDKKTCIDCHKGIAHKPVHKGIDPEELYQLK